MFRRRAALLMILALLAALGCAGAGCAESAAPEKGSTWFASYTIQEDGTACLTKWHGFYFDTYGWTEDVTYSELLLNTEYVYGEESIDAYLTDRLEGYYPPAGWNDALADYLERSESHHALVLPESIDGHPLTAIGAHAFEGVEIYGMIVLPETVESIGDYAFSGCKSSGILFGSRVARIGAHAFADCWTNPNRGYSKIDCSVPAGYYGVTQDVILPDSVVTIGDYAFAVEESRLDMDLRLSSGVVSIGAHAFKNCLADHGIIRGYRKLNLVLPDSLTEIGEYAFEGCRMESLTLGNGMTVIKPYTFSSATIDSVTISDSVQVIEEKAFYDCYIYENLTMGNSVTTLGDLSFDGLSPDIRVELPPSVTTLEGNPAPAGNFTVSSGGGSNMVVIDNCLIRESDMCLVSYQPSGDDFTVWIPDGVRSIGEAAFADNGGIVEVIVPEGVVSIGDRAFANCSKLTMIELPMSLERLGDSAFEECELDRVMLPTNLKELVGNPFARCTVADLKVSGMNPYLEIVDGVLFDRENRRLVSYPKMRQDYDYAVPDGTVEIERYAFYDNYYLKGTLTMPDSVEVIGESAFQWMALENLAGGSGVKEIGAHAFEYTYIQRTCSFPSLEIIGDGAFGFTHATLSLGTNLKEVGENAIGQEVDMDRSVLPTGYAEAGTEFYDGEFYDGEIYDAYDGGDGAVTADIAIAGEDPTRIADYACADSSSVQTFVVPAGVVIVGEGAFEGCTELTEVMIEYGAERIEDWAFSSCKKLTSVAIPASVTYIAENAFWGSGRAELTVTSGSYAEQFARENNINYHYPEDYSWLNP